MIFRGTLLKRPELASKFIANEDIPARGAKLVKMKLNLAPAPLTI
jgi:hypothetical protein